MSLTNIVGIGFNFRKLRLEYLEQEPELTIIPRFIKFERAHNRQTVNDIRTQVLDALFFKRCISCTFDFLEIKAAQDYNLENVSSHSSVQKQNLQFLNADQNFFQLNLHSGFISPKSTDLKQFVTN